MTSIPTPPAIPAPAALPSAPDSVTRPLDALGAAVVVLLCVSWGFNQVAIKLAMPDIPPLTQAVIRSICASILVLGWCWLRGIPLTRRDGTLWPGVLCGILFGLEFLFLYRGLLWTTASRGVLFLYLAPFFVVIGARWLFPVDRFYLSQWLGLALSFGGMGLAFGIPTPSADPNQLSGDVMAVGAALMWAGTTLMVKATRLNQAPSEKVMLYQLFVSCPILAIGVWAFGERIATTPSLQAVGWMLYQTVWIVSVTFVIWFALIVRYSASKLSAFTFLAPLCGVAAGHFLLNDPLTPSFLAAVALVILGLLIVNRRARPS